MTLGVGRSGVPERWLAISIRPPTSVDAGPITEVLLRWGARAVVEDGNRLVTHLPEPSQGSREVARLRHELERGFPGVEIETRWQPHQDWAQLWKEGLEPRRITDRLVVTPHWCEPEVTGEDLVLRVDPGLAFGTAEHGTTRGCLRLLDSVVRPGERVLDVGTGSGILAIGAALMGAGEVLALENDAYAAEAARDNILANSTAGRVSVETRHVDADHLRRCGTWDGVVSNIESGVLLSLLPGFRAAVAETGWLILGGILEDEWPEVDRAVAGAGFGRMDTELDEGWWSASFRKAVDGSDS